MAAAVVPDRRALVLGQLVEQREHLLERAVGPLGPVERLVQVVDVGLVVLVVVDAHRLLVDRRLERVVVVGKRGKLVGHAVSFGSIGRHKDMLRAAPRYSRRRDMALAYNHEEIAPRELKPALLELDGISRETIEAHYKLYQGYVNKRNEILGKLADVDPASANQVYSDLRSLKVDLSFAVGGIKNHEIYFEHLGGSGGEPTGLFADLVKRDFGSAADWKADLKATGLAGRGWAWTAYDWDEGRLFNYLGDAQNTFPVWNATRARRARRLRARVLRRLRHRSGRATSTRSSTTSTTTSSTTGRSGTASVPDR